MAYKAKTIRTMWDQVFNAADKLRDRVHKLMVVTLDHYRQHGDLSLFDHAVNGMHKRGVHRRAMIQWIQRHARATLTVNDGKVKFTKKDGADHTTVDVDKANASPFYDDESLDGRTGEDLKKFNFWGRIQSDIKKQRELMAAVKENDGDVKKAGYDPDKTTAEVDTTILDRMEEMVKTYGNLSKPQPKSDKALFRGAHVVTDPGLKATG